VGSRRTKGLQGDWLSDIHDTSCTRNERKEGVVEVQQTAGRAVETDMHIVACGITFKSFDPGTDSRGLLVVRQMSLETSRRSEP
jgi:hypothetical protein